MRGKEKKVKRKIKVTPEMVEAACRVALEAPFDSENISLQNYTVKEMIKAALLAARNL